MADWLRPKQVPACLWGLGMDTVPWEMAQQTVSHERALVGEEKDERAKTWRPVLHLRAGTWGPGSPSVIPGRDPCLQAIHPSSLTQVWRPQLRRHRHVSAFFLEAGWGEWGGCGD